MIFPKWLSWFAWNYFYFSNMIPLLQIMVGVTLDSTNTNG